MARLMTTHRPEFLEIGITMPQAKVLYLLEAAGEVHMSGLVAMLGVSLSTVSGLVDRLVDQGFATRREDHLDRRQVVVAPTPAAAALIERFRELNKHQFGTLLDVLSDDELRIVSQAMEFLARAAAEGGLVASNPDRPERISS
jgi:DNA-binding MarR family transcriptional regulator